MKRGANVAGKLRKYFIWILLALLLMVVGSAWMYWKWECGGQGSLTEALWTILFTLIGQGEFANNPTTLVGRMIIFALSIVGISLLGVVLSEVLTRIMKYNLKGLLGLHACDFTGHTILCGWNPRAEMVLRELSAAGTQVAVITPTKPTALSRYDAFFVAGEPSDPERLRQAGIEKASSAVIFAEWTQGLSADDVDAKTVLTALAVESMRPGISTVAELFNPTSMKHAKNAGVDDVVCMTKTLADVTALCASQPGIGSFLADVLRFSDDGSSFRAADIGAEWNGKTVGELFASLRMGGALPLGVMTPDGGRWNHQVNPPADMVIALPMRVVEIARNVQ